MNIARVKAARERLGLSQAELAAAVGVVQSAASQWERGERVPSTDNLAKLAKVLGVSMSWLAGEAVAESPEAQAMTSATASPTAILADFESPPGLRELASQRDVVKALKITSQEWAALRSLVPPKLLTVDGYLGILFMLRAHGAE
jgi:transcriptional regulator with XRE-family HTH domain